jgi:rhodanese-related sulfurtransferase
MHDQGDRQCRRPSLLDIRLCEAAEREIETIAIEDALKLHGRDDTVLVDIRDIRELQREGRVPGAFHCPRGMLEFWIDPQSPYHKPIFAADKKFVFFCAGGLRSALAAQTAQRMGLKPVAHIQGGFGAWKNPADRSRRRKLCRVKPRKRNACRHDTHSHHRQQELFVLVAAAMDRYEGCRHRFRKKVIPLYERESQAGPSTLSGGKVPVLIDGDQHIWNRSPSWNIWLKNSPTRTCGHMIRADVHTRVVAINAFRLPGAAKNCPMIFGFQSNRGHSRRK